MRPEDDDRRFFVVHNQKTAGTTLRARFRRHFGAASIYPNGTDGAVLDTLYSLELLRDRWQARRNEIRLISGHFPLGAIELLDGEFTTLTILRDPVERTLSYLRHQFNAEGGNGSTTLETLYDDPFRFDGWIQNHMTKMYSLTLDEMNWPGGILTAVDFTSDRLERAKERLAAMDGFGLQERFEEFCADLAARYRLNFGKPQRLNTTDDVEAPERLVERIRDDNAMDIELYEFASVLYDQRRM